MAHTDYHWNSSFSWQTTNAATVNQFRPITLFTMIYRLRSSIRRREALCFLAQHAPPHRVAICLVAAHTKPGGHIQDDLEEAALAGRSLAGRLPAFHASRCLKLLSS